MADITVLKTLAGDPPEAAEKPRKKPGRPKGSGKWPGSGRKPGGANQTTKELRARIHRRGKPVETICDVAAGKTEIDGMSRADALKLLYKSVVPEYRV